MSHRQMTVVAYDALDSIQITVSIRQFDPMDGSRSELELSRTTSLTSSGEPEPFHWAADALTAALEAL